MLLLRLFLLLSLLNIDTHAINSLNIMILVIIVLLIVIVLLILLLRSLYKHMPKLQGMPPQMLNLQGKAAADAEFVRGRLNSDSSINIIYHTIHNPINIILSFHIDVNNIKEMIIIIIIMIQAHAKFRIFIISTNVK